MTNPKVGPVALAGGNEFGTGSRTADTRLIELAGGPESPIVIVPTAAARQRPELAVENGVRHFRSIGALRVDPVWVLDPESAADPRHLAALEAARLIYLTGGDPRHLHDVFSGSAAWQAILTANARGAVLAGSSAGAMVLGAARGDASGRWTGVGLDVLPNIIVRPHFRPGSEVPKTGGSVNVLGIAEETTFLRLGTGWQNLGSGSVWVNQGTGVLLEILPGQVWEPR